MRGFAQALRLASPSTPCCRCRRRRSDVQVHGQSPTIRRSSATLSIVRCDLDHQAVGEGAGGSPPRRWRSYVRARRAPSPFAHAGRRRCRAVDHLSVKLFWRLARGGWCCDAPRIVLVGHAFCDESAARFAGKLLIVISETTGCHFGFCADRERRRAGSSAISNPATKAYRCIAAI